MTTVLSMLLIITLLIICVLFSYKLFLECKLLSVKLPAPKKTKRKRKVVYEDDLND